jgi:hypothetical protein
MAYIYKTYVADCHAITSNDWVTIGRCVTTREPVVTGVFTDRAAALASKLGTAVAVSCISVLGVTPPPLSKTRPAHVLKLLKRIVPREPKIKTKKLGKTPSRKNKKTTTIKTTR